MLKPSKETSRQVAAIIGQLFGTVIMVKLEKDLGTIEERHLADASVKIRAVIGGELEPGEEVGWKELKHMLRSACKRALADLE